MTPEQRRRLEENHRRRQRLVFSRMRVMMVGGDLGESSGGSTNGSISAYASYALAVNFKEGEYWASGTKTLSPSTLTSYSYTRSGVKGERNALTSGNTVNNFTTNEPGIVPGVGYWSRGPVTNLFLNSNTANLWSRIDGTIAADVTTAPDGTTTADRFTATGALDALAQTAITVTPSTAYTFSFFTKRGSMTDMKLSVFNISGSSDIIAPQTYFSETNTSDWVRVVRTFTTPVGCTSINVYPLRDSGSTGTAFFWGGQLVQGTYVDGGPIIPTSATTASVAADILTAGSFDPSLGDWVMSGEYRNSGATTNNSIMAIVKDASNFINFRSANDVNMTVGGTVRAYAFTPGPAANALVRWAVIWRGGKATVITRSNDVTTTSAEVTASAALFSGASVVMHGHRDAAEQPEAVVVRNTLRRGTFTNAAIIAELEAV